MKWLAVGIGFLLLSVWLWGRDKPEPIPEDQWWRWM